MWEFTQLFIKRWKKEIIKELTATWLQQQNERNKWYRSRRCFLCQLRFCQDVAFLVMQETFSWNALDSFPDLLSWVPVFTIPVAGIYIIAISLWEYSTVLFMPWASSSYTLWLRSCSNFLIGRSLNHIWYPNIIVKKERWCLFFWIRDCAILECYKNHTCNNTQSQHSCELAFYLPCIFFYYDKTTKYLSFNNSD